MVSQGGILGKESANGVVARHGESGKNLPLTPPPRPDPDGKTPESWREAGKTVLVGLFYFVLEGDDLVIGLEG